MVRRVIEQLFETNRIQGKSVKIAVEQWFERFPPRLQVSLTHDKPLYLALDIIKRERDSEKYQKGSNREQYLQIRNSASAEWWKLNDKIFNRTKSRFDQE